MKLQNISIENFRGLKEIRFALDPHANVIVGPNAVGKSTVLEAIRLAKAILAPRTPNENSQVLLNLGAASPHMPQQLSLKPLTLDESRPLRIDCRYILNDTEIADARSLVPQC